jgi:hypothetical protein
MKRVFILFLLMIGFNATTESVLQAQSSSTSYTLSKPIISIGGKQSVTENSTYQISVIVGQPFSHTVKTLADDGTQGRNGYYTQFLRAPEPMYLDASQGEYNDKIVLNWSVDPLQPAVNNQDPANPSMDKVHYLIYRNGDSNYGSIKGRNDFYIDDTYTFTDAGPFVPGRFYEYGLEAYNVFGSSNMALDIGFVNATGTIVGQVKTPNFMNMQGKPVPDVEIRLSQVDSNSPYIGGSVYLGGNSDYLSTSRDIPFSKDPTMTIEMQVLPDGSLLNLPEIPLFTNDATDISQRVELSLKERKVELRTGSSVLLSPDLSPYFLEMQPGTWFQLAVSWDETETVVYFNGTKVVSGVSRINTISNSKLSFGKSASNYFFKGNLDEIRIWDSAKDSVQIARYQNNTPPIKQGDQFNKELISYWKFDNESSNSL